MTGWGKLEERGILADILQEVEVPIIDDTLCETVYTDMGWTYSPEANICAGEKYKDSCQVSSFTLLD